MWTIDTVIMGVTAWMPTAGRFPSADEAEATLVKLAHRDCYGRPLLHRARPCTADELARRAA